MNLCVFMGRLTRDPEVRYTNEQTAIASFSLAVDRWGRDNGADFFDCTAFGKLAETCEKHLKKGSKVVVSGRAQNNNYTRKDGVKIYGVRFVVDTMEFAESKKAAAAPESDDWQNVPDGVTDEELPFI